MCQVITDDVKIFKQNYRLKAPVYYVPEVAERFGKNLLHLRKSGGMSRNTVVVSTGVALGALKSYEAGRSCPNLVTAYILSKFFDVDLERLIECDLSEAEGDE